MLEYMVHAAFRQQDQQAIIERIPQEREHIKVLMQQGTLAALYIASDSSGVWLVMRGEALEQIQKSLESLPLYPYMELTITPLAQA